MNRPDLRLDLRGVSLIEVLVALILLSIALSSLASLSYQVAQRSYGSSTASFATGIATEQLGLLSVLPWDSIAAQAGCETVSDPEFPHERCVTITEISKRMREITLTIDPNLPFAKTDTVVFRRARPRTSNPFN